MIQPYFCRLQSRFPYSLPSTIGSPGFKHDIVSLAMKLRKNAETGHVTWFVLEIYDITGRKIDPGEFIVDSGKIIRG
jgi:hypothetical protein